MMKVGVNLGVLAVNTIVSIGGLADVAVKLSTKLMTSAFKPCLDCINYDRKALKILGPDCAVILNNVVKDKQYKIATCAQKLFSKFENKSMQEMIVTNLKNDRAILREDVILGLTKIAEYCDGDEDLKSRALQEWSEASPENVAYGYSIFTILAVGRFKNAATERKEFIRSILPILREFSDPCIKATLIIKCADVRSIRASTYLEDAKTWLDKKNSEVGFASLSELEKYQALAFDLGLTFD